MMEKNAGGVLDYTRRLHPARRDSLHRAVIQIRNKDPAPS